MGFKITEKISDLSYDLRPYVDLYGVLPEPSNAQIERYRDAVGVALKDMLGNDTLKDFADKGVDMMKLASSDGDAFGDLRAASGALQVAMTEATSYVTPFSIDDLNALPPRVRAAFNSWVMGEFFSPEV